MEKRGIGAVSMLAYCLLSQLQICQAQQLVVGLNIDGLRTDLLERYAEHYGEHGFKRLWREARQYEAASYGFYSPDAASAAATVYTGTMPRIHGITAMNIFNSATLRSSSAAQDTAYMGNYTSASSSPRALQSATIGDEMKDALGSLSLVYSIAPAREAAIMAGGQRADNALWFDPTTAMWCSSTYYGAIPYFINTLNLQDGTDRHYAAKDIPMLVSSGEINSEINRLLPLYFDRAKLGQDALTDLLALTYTTGGTDPNDYKQIDRDVAALLNLLEQKVGKDKVLLFITSTNSNKDTNPSNNQFHIERARALLNMFLSATYGQGQWVEDHNGLQLHLNSRLIEEKGLLPQDVQQKSAAFLLQMSGVRDVYTATNLLQVLAPEETIARRNACFIGRSGDVWIDVMPGWTVVDAKHPNDTYTHRSNTPPSLLLFWGYNTKAQVIDTPVTLDRIAPTISKSIKIRAPNGCTALPLNLRN